MINSDSQTEAFFKVLFEGRTGFLELRNLRDGHASQRFFALPHAIADAAKYAMAMEGDVIFGVLPRAREGGKNEDIAEASVLWVDADGVACPWQGFPLPPTAATASGTPGHYHSYWTLTEPLSTSEAPTYLKAIALALRADSQATDLARCLRVPAISLHPTRSSYIIYPSPRGN